MQIEEAKRINMINLLASLGNNPKYYRKGGDEAWFLSPLHDETKPSFKITRSKNTWYDFGLGKGGNILDFLMEKEHTDVSGALAYLDRTRLKVSNALIAAPATPLPYQENVREIISFKSLQHPALFQYLAGRAIDTRLIQRISTHSFENNQPTLGELHYLHNGSKRFAIALKNDTGGFELRSKGFKGCIGTKDPTTIKGTAKPMLHLFEGMTDWLSLLTYVQRTHLPGTTIILNSINLIDQVIAMIEPQDYTDVRAYFDNDRAGQETFEKLQQALPAEILTDKREKYQGFKDLNIFLQMQ